MSKLKLTLKNGDVEYMDNATLVSYQYIGLFWAKISPEESTAVELAGSMAAKFSEKEIIACEVVEPDEIKFEVVLSPKDALNKINNYIEQLTIEKNEYPDNVSDCFAEYLILTTKISTLEEVLNYFNQPVQPTTWSVIKPENE